MLDKWQLQTLRGAVQEGLDLIITWDCERLTWSYHVSGPHTAACLSPGLARRYLYDLLEIVLRRAQKRSLFVQVSVKNQAWEDVVQFEMAPEDIDLTQEDQGAEDENHLRRFLVGRFESKTTSLSFFWIAIVRTYNLESST